MRCGTRRQHPHRTGARSGVRVETGHTNAAITLRIYAHLFDAERHALEAREGLESEYGAFFDQAS